jgi:hypothetical protein
MISKYSYRVGSRTATVDHEVGYVYITDAKAYTDLDGTIEATNIGDRVALIVQGELVMQQEVVSKRPVLRSVASPDVDLKFTATDALEEKK